LFVALVTLGLYPPLEPFVDCFRDRFAWPDRVSMILALDLIGQAPFIDPSAVVYGPNIGAEKPSLQATRYQYADTFYVLRLKPSVLITQGRISTHALVRFQPIEVRIALVLGATLILNRRHKLLNLLRTYCQR